VNVGGAMMPPAALPLAFAASLWTGLSSPMAREHQDMRCLDGEGDFRQVRFSPL
jgi:hypothetical protein